ncbi:Unknown protein sequence [Pseudomonas savastanoi pv. phaseolicola]|nr:Unknown protein sequence [Pseudomonas amygdali pv. mellea]KPB67340.1 Unknown protein sequence [Pseudomonas savastanoi pv. phaseolicola]
MSARPEHVFSFSKRAKIADNSHALRQDEKICVASSSSEAALRLAI